VPLLVVPIALVVASTGMVAALVRRAEERPRAIGMALFLAAAGILILAIVKARGTGFLGFVSLRVAWHAVHSVPLLCWLYFALELYTGPGVRRLSQMLLLIIACMAYGRTELTLRQRVQLHRAETAVLDDIRAGATPAQVAERHFETLTVPDDESWSEDLLTELLEQLRDAGIEPYRSMGPSPASGADGATEAVPGRDGLRLPDDP
jgi:hypothetical protein